MRSEIMEGVMRHIQSISGTEQANLLEISPGHSKISIEVQQESLNLYGNVHGGFLFSLCDIASGMSTYALERKNVTQCSSINYLRSVNKGTLIVESNAIHIGHKTVVNKVTITDNKEQLLVSATFTMFLGDTI